MVEPSGPEFLVQRASVLAGIAASIPGLWLMEYLYANHAELGDVTIFALCMVLPLVAWALVQAVGGAYLRRRAGR